MKLLVVIGRNRGPDGTPYVMSQVEDHAYEEDPYVRDYLEGLLKDALQRDYRGTPIRLVWIKQEDHHPIPMEMLTALIDGAQIPWEVIEDRSLDERAVTGHQNGTTA